MAIRDTDVFPPSRFLVPDPFIIGKEWWIDLAVDSQSESSVLWLRKSEEGKFRLVSSCVGGHIMKKDLTEDEARYVYKAMHTKAVNFNTKVVRPPPPKKKKGAHGPPISFEKSSTRS